MSADTWILCPICGKDDGSEEAHTVRIDYLYDIDAKKDGTIDTSCIKGYCSKCKQEFKG